MVEEPLKYVAAITIVTYLVWMIFQNRDIFKK